MGGSGNVLVVGYAREGRSVAEFLAATGARVTVSDRSVAATSWLGDITVAPESAVSLEGIDAVVVSPGIPADNPVLVEAQQLGVLVTNPTQLFLELCPCSVVGITGSSGKSTTSSLIAAIIAASGRHVRLGGNIGLPMLELLNDLQPNSFAVVEMSSFQLDLVGLSPHIAVVTNLTPNHLERHGTMEAYTAAKRNIFTFQHATDIAVVNAGDTAAASLATESPARHVTFGWTQNLDSGSFVDSDHVVEVINGHPATVIRLSDIPLPGRHNVDNVLAAVAVASVLAIPPDVVRRAILGFNGLPHRLQKVGATAGIAFVDDSIATSPERAAVGLDAIAARIIWIAGGRSKHLPWAPVINAGRNKVRTVVLVGEATHEIDAALRSAWPHVAIVHVSSITEAVQSAFHAAVAGDTILLSPGCTSFDQFADFEARGDAFVSAVRMVAP
jgi:UDP-N-acetylmuramoylalanine--D-glutamate ligase